MDDRFEKIDKIFDFFRKQREARKRFTLQSLKDATGCEDATIKRYAFRQWSRFLKKENGEFRVSSHFDVFTLGSFRELHNQKEQVNQLFHHLLVEKAVTACVSAIEIYNRVAFRFREENFSTLMLNAWELLLKAKIIHENRDDRSSIHKLMSGNPVLTSSGNAKSISIGKSLDVLTSSGSIGNVVAENIRLLIDIKEESVHFINNDMSLALKIQTIGNASIKNFMTLAMHWFGYDFENFNLYLSPVSSHNIQDTDNFCIDETSRNNLMKYLCKIEKKYEDDDDPNFSISLGLETRLVKMVADEAMQAGAIDESRPSENEMEEYRKSEYGSGSYPYTYSMLCRLLRRRYKNFKQNQQFNEEMKQLKSQGELFCKERRLEPRNNKSLYKIFYHSRILDELDKCYEKK